MKNRTINSEFIWNKWAVEKLTFAQIANLDIPRTVGMKRIKNIVYGGQSRCYTGISIPCGAIRRFQTLPNNSIQVIISIPCGAIRRVE